MKTNKDTCETCAYLIQKITWVKYAGQFTRNMEEIYFCQCDPTTCVQKHKDDWCGKWYTDVEEETTSFNDILRR